jgi:hypothetical protein
MALHDLITDTDGRLSHIQLWPNLASAAATVVFLFRGFQGTLTADEWLIYLSCVGGYSALVHGINAWRGRTGQGDGDAQ